MAFRTIKRVTRKTLPGAYRYFQVRVGHPAVMRRLGDVVRTRCGNVCRSGPFQGMRLTTATTGSDIPKLLGSYEAELHGVIEQIAARRYRRVVDVGCGEGYYAVGLALRLPDAVVHAFDINPAARDACAGQARLNGVMDRVRIGGECTPKLLAKLAAPATLIVSDCEGYEDQLLDPAKVPGLSQCDLLVELHEMFRPGVTARLVERLSHSHVVSLFDSTDRDPAPYPALQGLSPRRQQLAMNEARGQRMQWAWMTVR